MGEFLKKTLVVGSYYQLAGKLMIAAVNKIITIIFVII